MITKYRAWNKESKEMYACYGFNTFDTKNKLFICNKPNSSFKNGKLQTIHAVEVFADDYVLMQYTGLKDKNGVEIYEGDVLTLKYPRDRRYTVTAKVIRGSQISAMTLKFEDEFTTEEIPLYKISAEHNLEVLGNIYENPELLEVAK